MMFPESTVVVALLSNALVNFGEPEAQEVGAIFMR